MICHAAQASVAFSDQEWDPADYKLDFNHLLTDDFLRPGISSDNDSFGGAANGATIKPSSAIVDNHQFTELSSRLKAAGQLQVASAAEYLTYRCVLPCAIRKF
eukprot:scaffold142362_cov50-Prasinocladus_malaysianus.AAC.2